MHSPLARSTAVALSIVLAIVVGFALGAAYGAEAPTSSRPELRLASAPLAAVGGDPSTFGAAVLAEATRITIWNEAALTDSLARQAAAAATVVGPGTTRGVDSSAVPGPSNSGDCHGRVISNATAWRESNCSYSAYNATGCDGQGCIGYYQLHAMHYRSGGACSDLDTSPAGQDACAARLPASAWAG